MILLAFSLPVRAERWTLDRAVEVALEREPLLQSARESVQQSDAMVSAAISLLFPSVQLSGTWYQMKDALGSGLARFNGESFNAYGLTLLASQPLFTGGRTFSGLSMAKIDRELARLTAEEKERDLIQRVSLTFLGVLHAQTKIESLRRSQKVQEELLKVTSNRLRIGTSRRLEYLQQKTELALLRPRILQAENDLRVQATELAKLLRISDQSEIQVKGELKPLKREDLPVFAVAARSELKRAQLAIDRVGNQKNFELGVHYPQLSLTGQMGRSTTTMSGLLESQNTRWQFGLELSVPIFSGLSSLHLRRQLNSLAAQRELEEQALRDSLGLEYVQARYDLDMALAVLESSQEALSQSQEALKEARSDYRYGRSAYQPLAENEKNLLSAEIAYSDAQLSASRALLAMAKTSGASLRALLPLLK